MSRNLVRLFAAMIVGAFVAPVDASSVLPGGFTYYVASDSRTTIPTGAYANLANPNFGRLTFLLNHHDHFHSMGSKTYVGPPDAPTVVDGSNFRLPETFSGQPPLALTRGGPLGKGLYQGMLVNNPYDSDPFPDNYSDTRIRTIDLLAAFDPGTEENILFTSSGNRWVGSLEGTDICLELVELTDGLMIGSSVKRRVLSKPGDQVGLGGGPGGAFDPIYWTNGHDPSGTTYFASFKLVDRNGILGDSGVFRFDFRSAQAVPEPSTLAAAGIAGIIGLAVRRRRGVSSARYEL